MDLKAPRVFPASVFRQVWYETQWRQQTRVHIYPTCLLKRIKSWSEWRTSHVMHIPSHREPPDGRNHISSVPNRNPPQNNPLHPFLEIFSGRNCAVLKQIYFNTRHNIWTNKKKKKEHFYILLSRSKKKRRREHLGFLSFAGSAFWLLACDIRCFILRRGGDDTFRRDENVCWLFEVEVLFFVINKGAVQWIVCIGKCLS